MSQGSRSRQNSFTRVVVGGGGYGQRLARERDDADAIAREQIQQLTDLALGALEARRVDVLGQHRAREVERDHQVEPELLRGDGLPGHCGPRQRQHQRRDRDHGQRGAHELARHRRPRDIFAISGASPRRASRRRRTPNASHRPITARHGDQQHNIAGGAKRI
jgi:hypothetical protein